MPPTAKLIPKCYALNPPRISHFVVMVDDSPVAILASNDVAFAAAQLAILEPIRTGSCQDSPPAAPGPTDEPPRADAPGPQ